MPVQGGARSPATKKSAKLIPVALARRSKKGTSSAVPAQDCPCEPGCCCCGFCPQ